MSLSNLPSPADSNQPQPSPEREPIAIAGWVKAVLVGSIVLLIGALFAVQWTSSGPSWLSIEAHNVPRTGYLPEFMQVPTNAWDLALPSIAVLGFASLLRFIPSNNWTRLAVKSLLILLILRYFVWRSIATFNFATWFSTALCLLIYGMEAIGLFNLILVALQSIWSTGDYRRQQADRYEADVRSGRYLPSVDVFVPTYNEPEFIVRRTVMGCQTMDYPNKTIYILDDTRRPHIRELAQRLGCEYIGGGDNKHAKAGNLNNALPKTHGELITVVDSDFVPFKNFLTRTVGFFQDAKVALLQTPQDFYNPDHHSRNLGVDHVLPNDLAAFFNFGQSNRDAYNSVVCCGTSYVVRRQVLESVGGYYTRCVAEDSPTSTLMLTQGWNVIYLNETLSMGESTRNYADFLKQRLRWLQGNLQIFYCGEDIPIWSKLTLVQKSHWVVWLVGCFNPLFRVVILLAPIASIYLGVSLYSANLNEALYYVLPYMLFQVCTFSWSVDYHISYFWNEIYDTILCFPGLKRLASTLRSPFSKPFTVTPKGVTIHAKRYNLIHTYPLLIAIVLTLVALGLHIVGSWLGAWQTMQREGFGIIFFWLVYNLIIMSIAVMAAIDQPERRLMDRFPLHARCRLIAGDQMFEGYTHNLSESGAEVWLPPKTALPHHATLTLELPDEPFSIDATLLRVVPQKQAVQVGLKFGELTIAENRRLVELLYTEMTWWKASKRSGTLDALLTMLWAFLRFKPVLNRFS